MRQVLNCIDFTGVDIFRIFTARLLAKRADDLFEIEIAHCKRDRSTNELWFIFNKIKTRLGYLIFVNSSASVIVRLALAHRWLFQNAPFQFLLTRSRNFIVLSNPNSKKSIRALSIQLFSILWYYDVRSLHLIIVRELLKPRFRTENDVGPPIIYIDQHFYSHI